jgi:predicted transcriptional regulator of viral defense system
MHDTSSGPDHEELYRTASEQGGYFTAAQARSAGFGSALLSHHVKAGRFLRLRRGLYRYREYPSSPREDVIAAWLGTGADEAAVSHESALDLLELSDAVPDVVHLTVPREKRYRPAARGVAIHTTTRPLDAKNVAVRDGVRVTSPARSIVDAAEAGTAPEQIVGAVTQAVRRGMATQEQLLALAHERGKRVQRLIQHALDQEARE